MKKKKIAICIIGMFLLTSFGAAVGVTNNLGISDNPGWLNEQVSGVLDFGNSVCSIVVDSNNVPHTIVYAGNDNLEYWKRIGNDNWDKVSELTNSGSPHADLVIDSNNKLHVSWFNNDTKDLEYSIWTGSSWDHSKSPIDSTGYVGTCNSIDIDSSNNLHVSYYDGTNNNLKYAKLNSGSSSWSTETVDQSCGKWTSIAVDSNNKPHISYSKGNDIIKYARYTNSNWDKHNVHEFTFPISLGVCSAIDVGPNNLAQIIFWQVYPNGGDLFFARHQGDGVWGKMKCDCLTSYSFNKQADIKVDGSNNAHITSGGTTIRYSVYDGYSWFNSTVDSAYIGSQCSLYLDNENNPNIIYRKDMALSYIWYAKKININPNTPSTPSGPTDVAVGNTETYSTSTTDADGHQIYYKFFWGDGTDSGWLGPKNSEETCSASKTWTESGSFDVTVQAKDEYDGFSDISSSLPVNVVGVNHGGPYKGFKNYYVKFNGGGSSGTPPYTYNWDFGDGSTSNEQNPQHTYTQAKTYTVKLTVKDSKGVVVSGTTTAKIKELPTWIGAAIDLTDVNPSWDGYHFHVTIPFANFAKLVGIDASVPGDVDLEDFSGPFDFNFDWDNINLKIDLYPNDPDQDTIKLSGSASVDIDATDDVTFSLGVRADFEKIGDNQFNWELCFSLSGKLEFPVLTVYGMAGPIPISAQAKLYFKASAEFCLNSPDDFVDHVFGSVSGNLGVGAILKGGIGFIGIASVGLYTDIGGSWNFRAPEQDGSLYSYFSASLSFGAYAELIFVGESRWEWYSASWPSMTEIDVSTESSNVQWTFMPRNYGNTNWVGGNNDGLLIDEAFPMSHPNIDRNSNGDKMMVWVEDDKSKGPHGDGLDIWYSIWGTNKWNSPQRMIGDNLAQSNPTVAVLDNGDAICVFSMLEAPVGSRSAVQSAKDSEIAYCKYHDGVWSEPQFIGITPDRFTDSYPVIASNGNEAVVVWMCDQNPEITDGVTITDRILYASFWDGAAWSTPEILLEGNNNGYITSIPVSLAYDGIDAVCAYTLDKDGIIQETTSETQDIYITTFSPLMKSGALGDSTTKISNGGANAHPAVSYLSAGSPAIAWMKEDPETKNVDILYEDDIGYLTTSLSGPETVFEGLDSGSSTSIFTPSSGFKGSSADTKPVVAWSNGNSLCYSRRFSSDVWDPIQVLHMTENEITQTTWDYDGSGNEIFAVCVEKEEVDDNSGCQMFEAGNVDRLKPDKPRNIEGPGQGSINTDLEFETSSVDHTPYQRLKYGWDWNGDNIVDKWSDWIDSGRVCKMSHKWTTPDDYTIKVKAKNDYMESEWSEPHYLTITDQNFAPSEPSISGTKRGDAGQTYTYRFESNDVEGESIQYYVEWGDGSHSGWTVLTPSGQEISLSHEWSSEDTFTIRAKAKDSSGFESGWNEYEVTMPRSRTVKDHWIFEILRMLIDHFPALEQILKYISIGVPNI